MPRREFDEGRSDKRSKGFQKPDQVLVQLVVTSLEQQKFAKDDLIGVHGADLFFDAATQTPKCQASFIQPSVASVSPSGLYSAPKGASYPSRAMVLKMWA